MFGRAAPFYTEKRLQTALPTKVFGRAPPEEPELGKSPTKQDLSYFYILKNIVPLCACEFDANKGNH